MNSQQRAFREQLERLKIEASNAVNKKGETMSEMEKIKEELKAQREQERNQQ